MSLLLFIWTVGRRVTEEGLGGGGDIIQADDWREFKGGPVEKGLRKERDECRDLGFVFFFK